ncbi:hypothetical protein Vadar_032855 [Vaccinium darrowii]|uniref:Uncharacterized protein n=1 Tax=Vaccinium darrowii TaxID=229202 RepID=A0ACB7XVT4_9ERIC|nr:hypothetical protein Vadar_032855 [Vaccinium darrowii]
MRPSFNMYLHVLLFLSWLLLPQPTLGINTTTATTTTITTAVDAITNKTFFIAKPGCNLTCGNLTVPYPFGIGLGLGCSIDPEFDINCNKSSESDPPKAFRGNGTVEILSISQTQVRVRNIVASACYNGETESDLDAWNQWIKLGHSAPYTFSDEANKLTVVGCDDYAWIEGTFGGRNLSSGCMSQCSSSKDVGDNTGYCQTDIPKGLTYYNISLYSFNNHSQVLDAAQVSREALIRQIPKASIPDVPILPSAEEEPTEESTEHVEDESKLPAAT